MFALTPDLARSPLPRLQVIVDVGPDYRLSAATVCRHMTANTAVVIASAPGEWVGVNGGCEWWV